MGYYRAGDYYRGGGYYRAGGNIFKTIGGVVGGAVKGLIKGGPFGAITGAIGGAVSTTRQNVADATLAAGGTGSAYTPALRAKHNAAIVAAKQRQQITAGPSAAMGGGGGGFGRRHMNTLNPKALRRAARRLEGFEKHAKKALRPLGLHVVRHLPAARRGAKR